MIIPYAICKDYIKDADVLLFRTTKFPSTGWWIGKYTASLYSHAAIAHWEDGELYALEFKEFLGSRKHPMDQYVEEQRCRGMDVFRCIDTVIQPCIEVIQGQPYISYKELKFDADIALAICHTAQDLIGKPYSYWTIWQMFKTYIPFIRLGRKIIKNGEPEPKNFVCSTVITYAYRKNFIDPVPFLSDRYTTPGDLARSGLFSRLFEIKC